MEPWDTLYPRLFLMRDALDMVCPKSLGDP